MPDASVTPRVNTTIAKCGPSPHCIAIIAVVQLARFQSDLSGPRCTKKFLVYAVVTLRSLMLHIINLQTD